MARVRKACRCRTWSEDANMKGEILFVALLGIMLFIVAVQSVEIMTINKMIDSYKTTGSSAGSGSGAPKTNVPENMQNLPDMVGGC